MGGTKGEYIFMLDDVVDFFTAGVVGLLGWFFGGIDGFVKVLITFSIIDFITGLMAAYTKHELNSSVGFRGIFRKISMFCLVGVAHIVDVHMLGDTAMLKTSVTLFYAVNEGISIFENVDVLGIPIPQFLKDRLFNLKAQMISQEYQEQTTSQELAASQELATTQGNDKLTHRSRRNRASAANKEAKDNNKGKKQEGQRPQGSKEAGYDTGNYNVVALDISSHEFPRHHNVTGHSVNGANATVAEDSNSKTLDSKEDKEDKEEADTDNAESDDEDDKCVSNGAGE